MRSPLNQAECLIIYIWELLLQYVLFEVSRGYFRCTAFPPAFCFCPISIRDKARKKEKWDQMRSPWRTTLIPDPFFQLFVPLRWSRRLERSPNKYPSLLSSIPQPSDLYACRDTRHRRSRGTGAEIYTCEPREYPTLTLCWFIVRPASATLAQQ